jgi:hypothetical protein
VFVRLRGYIDESVDKNQNIFTMACLISTGKEWRELERAWKIYLAGWNRRLTKLGRPPITRYHASECRNLKGEFKGWSADEQRELTKGLLSVLKRSARTNTIAYDTNLADVCEVFPEASKDRLRAAYSILTKFLISSIGHDQGALDPTGKITLFHDRCDYDNVILQSFNQLVRDPAFAHGGYFTSIAPLSWEQSVALQPADLIAYEVFKETERRLTKPERETSKAFLGLLDLPAFGIRSRTLDRDTLFEIKATLYREGFPPKGEKDYVRILFRKPSDRYVKTHTHNNFTYLSGD